MCVRPSLVRFVKQHHLIKIKKKRFFVNLFVVGSFQQVLIEGSFDHSKQSYLPHNVSNIVKKIVLQRSILHGANKHLQTLRPPCNIFFKIVSCLNNWKKYYAKPPLKNARGTAY